ncbi:MAG: thrombospondin type 3 repeat-containing protein [Verrucomicrobiae bacterium]|nr:thrombospondin type 3 repeat-containing protein [Verrucomicrobiae bacterium]MDW8344589.1 hypothetical protein [Verrucomicrobiae bacterium]
MEEDNRVQGVVSPGGEARAQHQVLNSMVQSPPDLGAQMSSEWESGFANHEYMMSTSQPDPCTATNRMEELTVTHISADSQGRVTLTWPSCSNQFYVVEVKSDMLDPHWEAIAVVRGQDQWTRWTDDEATLLLRRFYRVGWLDPNEDYDGDGVANGAEFPLGTDPTNPDTDGDGMPDGWEVNHGLNPLVNDAAADPDGDGVDNLTEYLQGRDPNRGAMPDEDGQVNLKVFTLLE